MSGGSWDYAYSKFDDVADQLVESKNPLRKALGLQIRLIAKAMHDIEWVDSCDYGQGDDRAAIEAALGKNANAIVLSVVLDEAKRVRDMLALAITAAEGEG